MKNILSLFLSFCLCVGLVGCSSKNDDDILKFFQAFDHTLDADSAEIIGKVTIDTNDSYAMNLTAQLNQKEDLQLAVRLGLEAGDNRQDDYLDFYIKDGKTYLNNMGTKTQSTADKIGITGDEKLSAYNPFLDYTDDELTEFFTSSSRDGDNYSFDIDTGKLADALDSLGTVEVKEAHLDATIKNNTIRKFKLTVSGTQNASDDSADFSFSISARIQNYNKDVTVDFPDDLDSYSTSDSSDTSSSDTSNSDSSDAS
ncbi:hypothetical protein [Catenisphaera adipataccumulans]|uniref:Lipoprotein n=1 Tax=Catenisphaera adipataccumulans TaxID=700500 RepID=A0A7W8CX40_9FIRM|nr:hypothetical protein [Catenisphaera adipataccumulans]MBB5182014.1 hypothetical protein [Catenisphaera adipataccumulans]